MSQNKQPGKLEKMLAETIVQQVFNHTDIIDGKVYIQNYCGENGLIKKLIDLLDKYKLEVSKGKLMPECVFESTSALDEIGFV